MQNNSLVWTPLGALLFACIACSALAQSEKTLTIRDALSTRHTKVTPYVAPRINATATLDAIYGTPGEIRIDLHLNDRQFTNVTTGAVLSTGNASCKVTSLDLPARCIGLSQVKKGGDICPMQACWTGRPPVFIPKPSTLPLLPLPAPQSGTQVVVPAPSLTTIVPPAVAHGGAR